MNTSVTVWIYSDPALETEIRAALSHRFQTFNLADSEKIFPAQRDHLLLYAAEAGLPAEIAPVRNQFLALIAVARENNPGLLKDLLEQDDRDYVYWPGPDSSFLARRLERLVQARRNDRFVPWMIEEEIETAAGKRDELLHALVFFLLRLLDRETLISSRHRNVMRVSRILAENLALFSEFARTFSPERLRLLELASVLHDIGNLNVDRDALKKTSGLDESEKKGLQEHTRGGAELIRNLIAEGVSAEIREFLELAATICESHHEWYDGSGYPAGTAGAKIPVEARLVAVADAYDALRSPRPHREAFSHDEAMRIIRERTGSQFDPLIVEAMSREEKNILRLYAPGSEVQV